MWTITGFLAADAQAQATVFISLRMGCLMLLMAQVASQHGIVQQ